MSVENGEWIMFGTKEDDPECIHSVNELIAYINEVGFLPLFRNQIPGFSVEERTVPDYWWSGDKEKDPWEWREIVAGTGGAVYGKFFDQKAGFVSKAWLPYFANVRRDGYDFDSLWEDGKASRKQKKIMDLFLEENADKEYYSNELKEKAGYGKDGEKGFDGVLTSLQMQTYLVVRDFQQRKNKKGEAYGWPIAIYTTPEHLLGAEEVTSAYKEEPIDSAKKVVAQVLKSFPEATENDIRRIVLGEKGIRKEKVKKNQKKVDYPANLLKALELFTEDGRALTSLSADQMIGLEYALGLLKENEQNILFYRFEKGMTFAEVGKSMGRSSASCSSHCRKAMKKLKDKRVSPWITKGFMAYTETKNQIVEEFLKTLPMMEQFKMLECASFDVSTVFNRVVAEALHRKSIDTIGDLAVTIAGDPLWYRSVSGIGENYANSIRRWFWEAGIRIDRYGI